MHYYDFKLVGLLLRVVSPFQLTNFYELSHYRTDYRADLQPDAVYSIKLLPEDWVVQGELLCDECQTAVYEVNGQHHRYYFWSAKSREKFVLLTYHLDDLRQYTIYVQSTDVDDLLSKLRLSAFFALEKLMLHHHAFQLHSSVIQWNGQGILFSAPSGTGKSTQAELWRTLEDAQIINGDRGMIRLENGSYAVYGSPYAGTSGIYTNVSVPVRAIVVLSQAPENRLARLDALTAFNRIYRESTAPAWDADFVDQLSTLLIDLVERIPVYHLACRPDAGAVEILKQELLK